MDGVTGMRLVTLAMVLIVLVLPFVRYRRNRRAGESLGDWVARTESVRLNELGQALRTSRWLTPRLFLRSLWAMGCVVFGVFWFMALQMLLGDAVNLPWSWRRIASPLEPVGIALETVLLMVCFGFWFLFGRGRPMDLPLDGRRLAQHWLTVLAYSWLTIQALAWLIADPQFFITRMMVVAKPLASQERFDQSFARLQNASEEDLDRWIETGTLPRGFTANYAPRPAPPEVMAALRQRFAGAVPEPDMQGLSGGTFFMGCDPTFEQRLEPDAHPALAQAIKDSLACEGREKPRHAETVADFLMGRTEVTYDEWDACVADGGCAHYPDDAGRGRGSLPVTDVSWDDVQHYIAWLNARTGRAYRLPTEVEWEYAARAGTQSAFATGRCLTPQAANTNGKPHGFSSCPEWAPPDGPLAVGSLDANAWGLHDMHGNVAEWISDCRTFGYGPGQPKCSAAVDQKRRGIRGGSWTDSAENARSAYRHFARHDARIDNVGFRLALDTTFRSER
jgi:formylglycine-generating enzyme required for sulfatase activity